MKRATLTLLCVLALGARAWSQPSQLYLNPSTVTQPFQIDATTFDNEGIFSLTGITVVDGVVEETTGVLEGFPFQTQDTVNYINSGLMAGAPGFSLQKYTSKGQSAAGSLYNTGTINSQDTPVAGITILIDTAGFQIEPPSQAGIGINAPIPSVLQINATNITNNGFLIVGDLGLESLTARNLYLNNGAEVAGTVSDLDTNATSGRGVLDEFITNGKTNYIFTPPVNVFDLWWGVTNGEPIDGLEGGLPELAVQLSELSSGIASSPPEYVTNREQNTLGLVELPISSVENFQSYVYENDVLTDTNGTVTNVAYTIVIVNTAFTDTNITAAVGFLDEGVGAEPIINFSAPVFDVVSGETVTNSIFLLDTGAVDLPFFYAQNVNYQAKYGKPTCFEITTTTPVEWTEAEEDGALANVDFSTNMIWGVDSVTGGPIYKNMMPPSTNGSYFVQVGQNPQEADGLFPLTIEEEGATNIEMPNLTNTTGRLEITTSNLNVSNTRFRANGNVTLNFSNYTGTPIGTDWGSANAAMGNLKASLSVSNLFPTQFYRLRGNIAAWGGDWVSTQTNDGAGHKINATEYVHLLIVDQSLQDKFTPSVLNLALTGSNVVENDSINVLQSARFLATNLTFNSNLHLTGTASTFGLANIPVLQNLTLTSNASFAVDTLIDIGYPTTSIPGNPLTRAYSVSSITNFGTISSSGLDFQPRVFANAGNLVCTNSGSILMYAETNLLGAGMGLPNSLVADGNVYFSSASIQASNSTIMAGMDGNGRLNLSATLQLTDFLPGAASTNAYGTNFWSVTDGFTMTNKPAKGDLFGTQITTRAANYDQVIDHIWAAQDMGPTVSGFFNNAVIGHLILDRTTNGAILRFSAAGKKSAMYVDYLELRDLSFSDYHNGLEVDPNLTIYFANCNFDPAKLQQVYSNIIWVPQFAGPNSSMEVPYKGGSNCLMNALVASSTEISSDYSGSPNSKNAPFILDNPNPFVGTIPCPTTISSAETFAVTNTNNGVIQTLAIWTVGQGMITPPLTSVKVGQTYSQTARPDPGWVFLNWSGAVSSTQPSINFTMPATNAVLTATFVPNPFIALAGTYNGLFYPMTGPIITATNSGFVSFTVGSNGVFSGHLQINSNKYTFSSQFFGNGAATVNATSGTNVLTVTLQIDTTNFVSPSTQVSGQVSSGTWDAMLIADLAPVWTTKNPAPQTGSYTMVLPGNANAAASPGGDSYGTVTVNNLGNLTGVLNLADGVNVSLSQSVPVSASGMWPLYLAPSSGPAQPLIGWITFITNQPASFTGLVNWIKSAGPGAYYPAGFDTNSVLVGSIFSSANSLKLVSPTITLSGGNLPASVTEAVIVSGGVTYQSAAKDLTLTINAKTGVFSGSYTAAGSKTKVPLAGVVLQNAGTARGFFPGASESGAVLLQGNPGP